MRSIRRTLPWLMAVATLVAAAPAGAQGNIDAGKSPAQIFNDTCASCHRRAQDVKRGSAAFLRSHYTTGSEEAAAMANYLARVPGEARPTPARQQPAAAETPGAAAANQARGAQAKDQPKEQPKSAQAPGSPKNGRRGAAEARATTMVLTDAKPPETPEAVPEAIPTAAPTPAPAAKPTPVLEPFYE